MLFLFMEGENQGSEWPRSSQSLQPTDRKETLIQKELRAAISSLSSGRCHPGEASTPYCWQDCSDSQPGGNRSGMPQEGAVCRSGGSLLWWSLAAPAWQVSPWKGTGKPLREASFPTPNPELTSTASSSSSAMPWYFFPTDLRGSSCDHSILLTPSRNTS